MTKGERKMIDINHDLTQRFFETGWLKGEQEGIKRCIELVEEWYQKHDDQHVDPALIEKLELLLKKEQE